MTCKAITIVRGDDTNFNDYNFVTINLASEVLDLANFSAVFQLGDVVKTFDDLSSGSIDVNLSAQDTANLPPFLNGTLQLIDNLKRRATLTNTIPFKVISVVNNDAIATEPYTLNFDVEEGGQTILNITVETAGTATINGVKTLTLTASDGLTLTQTGSNANISGSELVNDINNIETLIPTEASESNQLADKNYVNSSIQDGTLTIQRNNSSVGTFSANQSSNETINISVPTQASDIDAVPTSRTVNNKALSSNITLTASDVGALSSSTTINDLTTEAQQDALNSGATSTKIGQIATNTSNISTNAGDIATINDKIPSQASSSNQLADKNFVNSSISTNTANFIGTFNSVAELEAYSGTVTNNDYAFVVGEDSDGNTVYNRYKYTTATTPASWEFEYALNNSSFTAAQWAAINSGATTTNIGLAESALQPNDNISELTNDAGYITGITSSDVTTALGYTPYNSSNPDGYTSNVGTVTSVNNTQPDGNGNVSITIPTVNDATLTIQKNGTTVNTFTANASSNVIANITVPTDVSDLTNTTLANKDLSNLSETGDKRLHALKSYKDEGELLTDAEGLADVTSYAHSTFDLSKFTVVGSPTITSNGIASGLGYSNYLTVASSGTPQTFEMIICFTTSSNWTNSDTETIIGSLDDSKFAKLIIIGGNLPNWQGGTGTLAFQFKDINGNNQVLGAPASTVLSHNTKYWVKVQKNSANKISMLLSTDGKNYTTIAENSFSVGFQLYNFGIGNGETYGYGNPFTGSLDLKQFSITVDGVPVFSGNKTGVDTIKPDDYTTVGSPTISDDGIASGFSGVNYIQAASFDRTKPFEIILPIKTPNDFSKINSLISGNNSSLNCGFTIQINTDGKLRIFASTNGTSWNLAGGAIGPTILAVDTNYYITFSWTGTTYSLRKSTDKKNWTTEWGVASSNALATSIDQLVNIGVGNNPSSGSTDGYAGSIDLNAFKIYVDGSLVYQPCLKISYTFSKTGSKIVDSVYRDRVSDMYSQFGFSNYYTLSGIDYTLPQGELYGNIQQTLRSSTVNGINKAYLYSDRMQMLTGSCTSGTEVTLQKPFANANYALSVPYSAKTATKFTPTQTGDWFAIGEGVL